MQCTLNPRTLAEMREPLLILHQLTRWNPRNGAEVQCPIMDVLFEYSIPLPVLFLAYFQPS